MDEIVEDLLRLSEMADPFGESVEERPYARYDFRTGRVEWNRDRMARDLQAAREVR